MSVLIAETGTRADDPNLHLPGWRNGPAVLRTQGIEGFGRPLGDLVSSREIEDRPCADSHVQYARPLGGDLGVEPILSSSSSE